MNGARPHLVTVLGPAGIGKSRLALEVATDVEAQGGRVLWGRSLPYEEQTPYRGVAQIVRVAAGIYENDAVQVARQKLAATVATLLPEPDVADTTRYLSLLLGLGLDEPASEVIHLQFATRRFVEHLSLDQPLLLVFEDIHWADDVLLDLIEYLVSHVQEHRIVFLALARPEFLESRPNWGAGYGRRHDAAARPPHGHRGGGGDRVAVGDRAGDHGGDAWSRRPEATRCSSRSWWRPSPMTRSRRNCPARCSRRSRHGSTRCRPGVGPRSCTPA